jgi:uncharacterized protein (TIGR04255 family)
MKTHRQIANDLPEYDNPPVTEVVCGVMFKSLQNFRMPHFGLFWKLIEKEFPACQEVAPLLPIIERYGAEEQQQLQVQVAFADNIPLPRIWFLDAKGTGILQLQRDRLLHNWKKNKPTDAYPRYSAVIGHFQKQLDLFVEFLKDHDLGAIDPLQYEMTYVNHIPKGEGWNDLTELGSVFRDHQWQEQEGRFLSPIEHVNLGSSFVLPNRKARLHVSIRDGKRLEDRRSVLLFELTVRGFPSDGSTDAMWRWFDSAREWIVKGFTDLTTADIQKKVWRRTR